MPIVLLLGLLAGFPALSTDMFLPALPTLQALWGVSFAGVSLALTAYFVSFSAFLLVHGPLADRIGRKPVLIGGILVFLAGSALCVGAESLAALVAGRVVQGIGAAAASSLSLALAKDMREGAELQRLLAHIAILIGLCPMLAPTLGGMLLTFASWRVIFAVQGALALVALFGVLRLKEPDIQRTTGGLLAVAGRYLTLARNPRYIAYVLAFSCMTLPWFAFIAGSPDIYLRGFGIDRSVYGLLFGLNAAGYMLGSFLCSKICMRVPGPRMLVASLLGMMPCGVWMIAAGSGTLLQFVVPMFLLAFFLGVSRPISNQMVLEQVKMDIGAASSLLTFSIFIVGAVAMQLIALDWSHKTVVLGVLAVVGVCVPLSILAFVSSGRPLRRRAV